MVDIVNSTNMDFEILESDKIKQYYTVFLNTMTSVIKLHNGKVIKNSGDNLLYYFPRTSDFNDELFFQDVIECGLKMLEEKEKVDLIFNLNGLSCIDYRISANYGLVELAMSNNSLNVDLFGTPVNICSKINHLAKPNEMVVYKDLFEVIKKMSYFKDYLFRDVTGQINNTTDTLSSNSVIITNYDNNKKMNNSYTIYSVQRLENKKIQKEVAKTRSNRIESVKKKRQNQKNSYFNILLIDDDEDILFTFSSIISSQGYKTEKFSDSYKALEHFAKINPFYYDLVIMDIRMPGINGIKLYSHIKIINPEIKVLFVSALIAIDEMLSIFPDIKMNQILSKPIDPNTLLLKISQILREL